MRASRAVAICCVGLLWAAVPVLAFEAGLRVFAPPPVPVFDYDPLLGWRFARNLNLLPWLRTNAEGFRDRDHALAKTSGTFRVLLLGDSYAAGTAVPEGENFPALLEGTTAPDGRPLEILNASVPGWATDQEFLYLREEGMRFHPDLVLLLVVPNDLREAYGKRFFTLGPDGVLRDGPRAALPLRARAQLFFLRHSAIVQWLGARYGFSDEFALFSRTWSVTFPMLGRDCTDYDLLHDPPDPAVLPARALFEKLFLSLRDTAHASGAGFAATVIPTKMEFTGPTAFHPLVKPGLISDYVKKLSASNQVPFLDLFSAFPPGTKALRLFLPDEFHFNREGHRFVAARLADWLRYEYRR